MAGKLVFRIGMSLEAIDREIVANVEAAVAAADRGESFEAKRAISFENWATFFRSMTPNRIAVLEYVAAHDPSTRALSIALGRDYAAVHADVAELVKLGLVERDGTALRCEVEPDRAELAAAQGVNQIPISTPIGVQACPRQKAVLLRLDNALADGRWGQSWKPTRGQPAF